MTMGACATCNPPVLGSDRSSEVHIGIRFKDHTRGKWTVLLDGEDVTNRCTEALAGEPGWVVLYVDEDCNGTHQRTVLQVGHVHVRCTPKPQQPCDLRGSTDS
jgi:hypothetical protein